MLKSVSLSQIMGMLKQFPHLPPSSILRKRVDKPYPWKQRRFTDIILLRIGAKRDKRFTICQKKNLCALPTKLLQSVIPKQFIKKLPSSPVGTLYLLKPVILIVSGIIIFDFKHMSTYLRRFEPKRLRVLGILPSSGEEEYGKDEHNKVHKRKYDGNAGDVLIVLRKLRDKQEVIDCMK